jgi:glutamate dehydrogenase (NAD(P)+)
MIEYDEFGPEKILKVYDPKTKMKGFVVIDNTSRGPGKGGIRMTSTVSEEEVCRLARAMTWKNALADLHFGGAKSGIQADPKSMSLEEKEKIVRSFARAIKELTPSRYIGAPDMNMAETEMKWIVEELDNKKVTTGKPMELGGLPHELGSTGFGVFHATKVAVEHLGLDFKDLKFAVEGFGNVGQFASKFLTKAGSKLIAASDSQGVILNENGINFEELLKTKQETGSVINFKEKSEFSIIDVNADILITAAQPDLIKNENVDKLKFKIIVQGSNIPMTYETEELCHGRNILIIPDFVANSGGVISSYIEHIEGTKEEMFKLIEEKLTKNTKLVLEKSKEKNIPPRLAGLEIAKERIKN